jgi:transposase
MLGHKTRDFRPLTAVSLEDLVPEDNFYRQVERSLDLNFVHDLANDFYSNIGRPSIDPVVFFKLQLIAFFEGIRSVCLSAGTNTPTGFSTKDGAGAGL